MLVRDLKFLPFLQREVLGDLNFFALFFLYISELVFTKTYPSFNDLPLADYKLHRLLETKWLFSTQTDT